MVPIHGCVYYFYLFIFNANRNAYMRIHCEELQDRAGANIRVGRALARPLFSNFKKKEKELFSDA